MERFYVDGSFKSQYDDIARRVLSIGGRAVTGTRGGYTNNEVLVKISGIYEPDDGYGADEQLQLICSEVIFNYDGTIADGVLNFDPDDTTAEEDGGKINLAVPIYVLDVDFNRDSPQSELETYRDKIIRASQFSMLDEEGEYQVMWVAKLGGIGAPSRQYMVITNVDEGESGHTYQASVYASPFSLTEPVAEEVPVYTKADARKAYILGDSGFCDTFTDEDGNIRCFPDAYYFNNTIDPANPPAES